MLTEIQVFLSTWYNKETEAQGEDELTLEH